jgi:putative oxidoreductase
MALCRLCASLKMVACDQPFLGAIDCRAPPRTLISTSRLRTVSRNAAYLGVAVTRLDRGFTALQRLFSMFPNGWPGLALLLLRLAAGILLIHDGAIALQLGPDLQTIVLRSLALGAGTLLLLGLWTPVAGVLVTLVEVYVLFLGTAHVRSSILLGTVGAALAALGPGSTSIDARLFGRRRLDIREP